MIIGIFGLAGLVAFLIFIRQIRIKPLQVTENKPLYIALALIILSLILQFSFLFSYISGQLVSLPDTFARVYWISSSLSGIILGFVGLIKFRVSSFVIGISFTVFTVGIGLLALLGLALFITSM